MKVFVLILALALRTGICALFGWFAYLISSLFGMAEVIPFEGMDYSLAFLIGFVIAMIMFFFPGSSD